MSRVAALLTLVPALLLAGDAGAGPIQATTGDPASILGGRSAPAGRWPDVVAVYLGAEPECTGTLIAPTVVLTAGHCVNRGLTKVVIGTSNLRSAEGEEIGIARQIEHPDSWDTFDVALLILERPAKAQPRALATGWVRPEIKDGVGVSLVGFGATDSDGKVFVDALQEAETTVTDADCSASAGCNTSVQPAGELGAGGGGVDTCVGDSGGPMYVTTAYGTYLAAVTSRAYSDAPTRCSAGGIYVRVDRIVDWIERSARVQVTDGPIPTLALTAEPGLSDVGTVDVNDPLAGGAYTYALVTAPANGTAVVRPDGSVVYTPKGDYVGADPFTVQVTDAARPERTVVFTVAAESVDGGLCAATGRPTGALAPAALAALALVRRRRRAARLDADGALR